MQLTETTIYQKAFREYLRYGTPMEISIKAMTPTTPYYIWRTQEDNKVRPSHAANNGKVFAWDNPPPTGNPGEAWGCRCWAEAYEEPNNILNPNGKPFGAQGMKSSVRIAYGGEAAAKALYEQLSQGGTPDTPLGYPGEGTRLPNGGWVGYRPMSKSGTPTIDINIEGLGFEKIHFLD